MSDLRVAHFFIYSVEYEHGMDKNKTIFPFLSYMGQLVHTS